MCVCVCVCAYTYTHISIYLYLSLSNISISIYTYIYLYTRIYPFPPVGAAPARGARRSLVAGLRRLDSHPSSDSRAQHQGARARGLPLGPTGTVKHINRSHTRTHRQRTTPLTPTHTHTTRKHPKPSNEHLPQTFNNAMRCFPPGHPCPQSGSRHGPQLGLHTIL